MQDLVANHKVRQCVTWPQPRQWTPPCVSKHTVFVFNTIFSLQYFFHNRNAVEVGTVIREAYRLQESTPAEVNPKRMLEPFTPLTKGQYPIFNKYPKFIVDYQVSCWPSLNYCTLSSTESCWKWTFNLTTRAFFWSLNVSSANVILVYIVTFVGRSKKGNVFARRSSNIWGRGM